MRHVLVLTTSYPRFAGDPAGHFVESAVRDLLASGDRVTVLVGGAPTAPPKRPTATPPAARPHDAATRDVAAPDSADTDGGAATRDSALTIHYLGGARVFGSPGVLANLRRNPARIALLVPVGFRLLQVARRFGPAQHVVMHWLVPSAFPGQLLLAASGALTTTTTLECVLHGSDARLVAQLPRALRTLVVRAVRSRATKLTFVSHALRDTLAAALSHDAELSSWVSTSRVSAAPLGCLPTLDQKAARRELGIEAGERLFVVVGRLVSSKRTRRALGGLDCIPDARVVVVGDGPERAALARDFPRVRFVGEIARDDALRWIAAADCLVSASEAEGAPTVVREARALGALVVSKAAGDVARWATRDPGLFVVR